MAEVRAGLSARELTEWAGYELVTGPLGPERLDYLFASLAATVANVNRPKGRALYKLEDFMIKWDAQARHQMDPAQMRRNLWAVNNRRKGR